MSGIVGVWNLDGRPVEKSLLARLGATLAHRGPDGEGLWVHGPVGMACRLLRVTPEASAEHQPLVSASGRVLVFDGRLDNREEILANLEAARGISGRSPDPTLVLAAYEAFGDRFAERLRGDFALGLFDPERRQLLLARDSMGVRPLYYCRIQEMFLFASEVKALLAHPNVSPQPNPDHLAELLVGGPPQQGEGLTFFKGIFSLLPAHVAILTPERLRIRRYWDFEPMRQIRLPSFREYAEAFRDHFERAVTRRLRSAHPVAVSVSGGLDSSSIFCMAEALRRRSPGTLPSVLGISYTSPDGSPSDEKAFLVEIERDYSTTIERLPMAQGGFVRGSREVVWHVEAPFLDELGHTTHRLFRTVHRRGARVVLTGHWGDQMLFDQAYLIDLFQCLRWGEVRAHLREFGRWLTDADPAYFRRRFFLDLVRYHVPPQVVPLLRRLRSLWTRPARPGHCFTETFRRHARRRASRHTAMARDFPAAHGRSLYEEARSSYHVLCMEWDNKVAAMHGLEIAFPFLDRDLVAFLMAIPGEIQTWKGIPKALLREGMRDVLPYAIVQRTWKADFTDRVNDGVESDFRQLVRCLESGRMALRFGYLNGHAMRKELAEMKARLQGPSCETAWHLSDLLALELWLQIFMKDAEEKYGEK